MGWNFSSGLASRACIGAVLLQAAACGGWAHAQSVYPDNNPPGKNCQVSSTFPDGSSWKGQCFISVIRAGEDAHAPKGMVRVIEKNDRTEIFSLSFYPPKDIKVAVPYPLITDRDRSFLNALVQPYPGKEICHLNKQYPGQGNVVFAAIGTVSAQFHGVIELFPTCSIFQATPEQRMVTGGEPGAGKTTVNF